MRGEMRGRESESFRGREGETFRGRDEPLRGRGEPYRGRGEPYREPYRGRIAPFRGGEERIGRRELSEEDHRREAIRRRVRGG